MPRVLAPIVLLIVAVVASVWSDRPLPRADLVIVERAEVNTVDPHQASWNQDLRVARALFEGLLAEDTAAADQRLVPAVARELPEISPDGRVYIFRLRAGLKWSDGSPLTARDFVYAWRRGMLSETAADYSNMFMPIRGAEAFANKRAEALAKFAADPAATDRSARAEELWREALADFEANVGVRAVDDLTLRVELDSPLPHFPSFVAFPALFPLCESSLSRYESLDPRTGRRVWSNAWARPGVLVGNGPYRLTLWRFKRDMRLERNEHYRDASLPRSSTLSILNIADANSMVLAFRTGAVDWTTDVAVPYRTEMLDRRREFWNEQAARVAELSRNGLSPAAIASALPPDPRNTIHAFPSFGTSFLNLNCSPLLPNGRPNPLADARVRRALAMALNKREITEQIRRIGEPAAGSLVPPGSLAGYTPPAGLPYDPERAQRELAEAGYPGGAGFPPMEFLFRRDGGQDLLAQAIARQWERKLGIRVLLLQVESRVFGERLKSAKYMVSTASWFGDYGDATTFLDISLSGSNNNDRKYQNPRYDELLARAAGLADPAERAAALAEAERMLVETDLPLIPLFHFVQVYLFDPTRLEGLSEHPRQIHTLARLKRREPAP
jgi:oligopeptide transport system substrate-binding protein